MNQATTITIAREVGFYDFTDGVERIPAQSGSLRGLHLQHHIEFGTVPELLKAWLDGWDQANLIGPAYEDDDEEQYHDGSDWRHCWHGYRRGECPGCNPTKEGYR